MKPTYVSAFLIVLAVSLVTATTSAHAKRSAEPGATVRNAFGPPGEDGKPNQCRGACGGGCPKSCDVSVSYECAGESRFRRVVAYDCGTHLGCRAHDDCLDDCLQAGGDIGSCSSRCDAQAMQDFGFESAGSWLTGGGPYDGRTLFEYTRDASDALEPAFRCQDGASEQCSGKVGCLADGAWVEPVFDSYPDAASGAIRIAAFRSGPACGERVCEQSADIVVSGADTCPGGQCTQFGMEFDYENADPTAPLECRTSTSGDGDFIGDLLKQGADAMESRGTTPDVNSEDGMQALMGMFGKVLASADSPEDLNISITPLDEDGNPIESQRVGSQPANGPPPIPNRVDLPATRGHLFVPMYQLASTMQRGEVKERRVRCTHKEVPVLDTTFRLSTR